MQVRSLHIRLSKEHQHADEAALNQFLNTVTVKKKATQFVTAIPSFWSILVYYERIKGAAPNDAFITATVRQDAAQDKQRLPTAAQIDRLLRKTNLTEYRKN